MNVVFHATGRRGLGHLMRGNHILREIQNIEPRVRVTLLVRGEVPASMIAPEIEVIEVSTHQERVACVHELKPTLEVHDTLLPKPNQELHARRQAFIWRRCKSKRHHEMQQDPSVMRFDSILIPHDRDEFEHAFAPEIAARTEYVGPIVRAVEPAQLQEVRSRFLLTDEPLLISTPGGGGFAPDVAYLANVADRVQRILVGLGESFRHLMFVGPNYRCDLPQLCEGIEVHQFDPQLIALFKFARCVITAGGYNTLNELRLTQTPAIILPGSRTHDDQAQRAARLRTLGLAQVGAGDPRKDAELAARLFTNDRELDSMRIQHQRNPLRVGNRRAARALLRLL